MALLVGFLTDDWLLALPLGITLELLWLDIVPLGNVVPPQGTLSYLLLFPLARLYGWSAPGPLLLPILLAVLAAYGAALLERSQRVFLNGLMPPVEQYCLTGRGLSPGYALLLGALLRAGLQWVIYMTCFIALAIVFDGLDSHRRGPLLLIITWPMMYATAMLGGILSLRIRRAYAVLVVTLLLGAVAFLAQRYL